MRRTKRSKTCVFRADGLTKAATRILFGIVLIGVLISGCSLTAERPPIADSTMIELLMEFHLANGRVDVTGRAVPDATEKILRAYGVDSTTYLRALSYYADHPEEYSELYGRVIEQLTDERMGTASDGDSTLDLMQTPSELGRLSP